MIALGVVAAVWLSGGGSRARGRHARGRRRDRHVGGARRRDRGPAVPRGHRLELFERPLVDVVTIWQGGLGIPGGMLARRRRRAVIGAKRRGIRARRRRRLRGARRCRSPRRSAAGATGSTRSFRPADHAAVGAARSTTSTCAPGYAAGTTFHPTFLYESLWNLGLCGFLLWIDRRWRAAPRAAARRCTSRLRHRPVLWSRACASTPPTRSPACG